MSRTHDLPAAGAPRPEAESPPELLQRAQALAARGQPALAIETLQRLLTVDRDQVAALLLLGELQLATGRYNEGRTAAFQALQCHMDSPRTALRLIQLLGRLSESGVILEMARQAPPRVWDSAQSLTEVSQALSLSGAHELGLQFARAAVERDPGHPPSQFMLATAELFHGNLEAAAELTERCLARVPDHAGSHLLLSRLGLPGAERRIDRVRALLRRPLPDHDRAELGYALHNELHEIGDYGRAWDALGQACTAKRATLDYDPAEADALFAALRIWTPGEVAVGDGHDDDRLVPVFVIGLHRSGTTLAERILGGHSRIAAGGETYDVRAALRRATGRNFPGELDRRTVEERASLDYREIGFGYLHGIAWRAAGKRWVTDKLPSNYMNVGFVARALPRARFIHLNRDPVDVGLSSLRTLFSHACPYSYDQRDYVRHWRNYDALMAHWRRLLPDRILDVDYQEMVDDPDGVAARMARFCGLEPEPGMADIQRNTKAVSTASSVMMRAGIRRDRGHLWERYRAHLAPMLEAFGRA
jgi:tetratricopeptide (TPR) repeat protein